MIKKWILIFVLLIPYFHFAQEDENSLVTFTEKDGIPSNSIYSIIQDHLGYIWVATENGLLNYDGYKFKRYNLANELGIPGLNPITSALFEDSENNLWIGTYGGVIKYNRLENEFRAYSIPVKNPNKDLGKVCIINEDSAGRIWLGVNKFINSSIDNGLAYIKKGEHKVNLFYGQNDSARIQTVNYIDCDMKNNLWVSSKDGLRKIDLNSMNLEKINFKNSPIQSFNSAILIDDQGILWGCLRGKGFGSYNPLNGKVKFYSFSYSNVNSISNNRVNSIVQDKDGTLWLGTNNGVNHFDPKTGKFKRYFYHEGLDVNYKDIGIVCTLFKDKSGSIWLGSEEKFLHKYDPSKILFRSFKHNPNDDSSVGPGWIFGLAEDNKGNYWIAGLPDDYNSGLTKYNPIAKTLTRIPDNNKMHPGISTIYKSRDGRIWLGTFWSGLLTFNLDDNEFQKYKIENPDTIVILTILEDHNSKLWLGTDKGLFILNRMKKIVDRVYLTKIDSLEGTFVIQHMIESSKKEIWLGTTNGLFKYDYVSKTFTPYYYNQNISNSLSSSNIGYIYEDKNGILWLGTWGGGLNRFDPVLETFEHYTMRDGLPSNNIQGILGDEEGNALWLSTFEGISRFDLSTKEFRNFDASHGVQGKQFARASALETSKGEFLFGGSNGLNIFRPKEVLTNLLPPDILISDFKVFNKSLKIGKKSPLKKPIYQTDKIILPHDENDISIDYRAVHYVDPTNNEYAYKLENYENDWRYVDNSHSAIYPNLPPGDYIFHVKAANNADVWNNKGKSLAIIILPPWWKTNIAFIIYGILFIGFIFGVDQFQRRRLLAKAKEKMKIQNAEHRAESAELQAKAAEAQARVIQVENERKTKELDEARELQLSMLPKELPKIENLEIAVYMQTATEVGGDYYDFQVDNDGSLIVALGDATGHGMKAGTLVTLVKGLFTSEASSKGIIDFFNDASKTIKEINLGRLLMAFSLLKIKGNRLQFSSAGLPPMYIYRNTIKNVEEIDIQGMPLGAMKNFGYKLYETELNKGDCILLLSDGYPELVNADNKQIGYERLQNQLLKITNKKLEEIIQYFKNFGSEWVNGKDPDDDVTFVVIKVK